MILMRLLLLVTVFLLPLVAADKAAEKKAAADAAAAQKSAAQAVRSATSATRQRAGIEDENRKRDEAMKAIIDRNTVYIQELQAAIKRNADTMAVTKVTTEATKATGFMALVGVIITGLLALAGAWLTVHRSNKTDQKVAEVHLAQGRQEQQMDGRFTEMAELIRTKALLEGADIERQRARNENK